MPVHVAHVHRARGSEAVVSHGLVCADCSSLGLDTAHGHEPFPERGTCYVCGGPWPLRQVKFRVVEAASGQVAKTKSGSAADGGGHHTKESAEAQARAINAAGGK